LRERKQGIVQVVGMGGSGKTRLLLDHAHRVRGDFRTVVWIDAYAGDAQAQYADLCERVAARRPIPFTQDARISAVREAIETSPRALVVIDGAERLSQRELKQLVSTRGNVLTLIGSRSVVPAGTYETLALAPLPTEAAVELLGRGREWSSEGKAQLEQLSTLFGGLPLALAIANGLLVTGIYTPFELLAELQHGVDGIAPVSRLLEEALDALDDGSKEGTLARRLWMISGALGAAPIARKLLEQIEGIRSSAPLLVGRSVARLVDHGIASVSRDGEVSFHPLVRSFARQRVGDADRAAVLAMWTQSMKRTPRERAALLALRPLCSHLKAAVDLILTGIAMSDDAFRVPLRLAQHLREQGDFSSAVDVCRSVLPLTPDGKWRAYLTNELGQSLIWKGEVAEARAVLEESVRIKEETIGPEHFYLALSYRAIGDTYVHESNQAAALDAYDRAIALTEQTRGEGNELAEILRAKGDALVAFGRAPEAHPLLERAFALATKMFGDDHPTAALARLALALALRATGDVTRGNDHLRGALATLEEDMGAGHPIVMEARRALASSGEVAAGRNP
jgi:tetratricopeptide (TPR) repeat protein